MVAHINPQEAMILKLLGGSGTRNPKTGLLEFKYGADTKEGGAKGTGSGAGTGASGRGGNENAAAGRLGASERDSAYGGGYGLSGGTVNTGGATQNENALYGELTRRKVAGPTTTAIRDILNGYTKVNTESDLSGVIEDIKGFLGLGGYGNEDDDSTASVVDKIAQYAEHLATLSGAPTGLGTVASLVQAGGYARLKDLQKMASIAVGAEPGSITNTSDGPIAEQHGGLWGGVNSGTTNVSKLAHDIASGSFTGGDLGGYRRDGAGGPGNGRPLDHAATARAAQQANAGGGLVAALNPTPMVANPDLPPGLLPYLAQSLGLIPGYSMPSRFGTGTVAPITYGQPYA
jgi:hypothetical protein